MNITQKKTSFKEIILSVCAVGAIGALILATQPTTTSAQQSNFMGGAPQVDQAEEVTTLRILFPAGVRSNWHTHSWGQLLMVEEGRGVAQDRGGPMRIYSPGEPFWTPSGVEHWHGAHRDEDVLQMTIYEGTVNWMEPVSDEVYNGLF